MIGNSLSRFMEVVSDQERVSSFVLSFGILTPVVLALLQVSQVLIAVLPGYAVIISGGYLYGLSRGFFFNLVIVILAGQVAFGIARYMGRPLVYRLASARIVEKMEGAANKYGFGFFLIGFLFPIFPADTMNYVGGLSGISGRTFLGASILGKFPSLLLMTWMGANGSNLAALKITSANQIFIGLALIALFPLFYYFSRLLHKQVNRLNYRINRHDDEN